MLAMRLDGYEDQSDMSLYNRFLNTSGSVHVSDDKIVVKLSMITPPAGIAPQINHAY
jgi:hypothetical protein